MPQGFFEMTGAEVAAAAVVLKAGAQMLGGILAGGASKVQAQFAALAAYQRGSDISSALNVALASQAVAGRASGFASTGDALMDADRTRAAQDIEAARYQGFLESNALENRARAQVFEGYAAAAGTAADAASAGLSGGKNGGGGGMTDEEWRNHQEKMRKEDLARRRRRGTIGGAGGVGGG